MSLELIQTESADASGNTYALAGALCIFNAAEAKSSLLQLLEADSHCRLDLSPLSEIDTAGAQLLLLLAREAAALNCRLEFVDYGETAGEMIELLGLGDVLISPQDSATHGGELA